MLRFSPATRRCLQGQFAVARGRMHCQVQDHPCRGSCPFPKQAAAEAPQRDQLVVRGRHLVVGSRPARGDSAPAVAAAHAANAPRRPCRACWPRHRSRCWVWGKHRGHRAPPASPAQNQGAVAARANRLRQGDRGRHGRCAALAPSRLVYRSAGPWRPHGLEAAARSRVPAAHVPQVEASMNIRLEGCRRQLREAMGRCQTSDSRAAGGGRAPRAPAPYPTPGRLATGLRRRSRRPAARCQHRRRRRQNGRGRSCWWQC
mmetsp:Transcript_77885/g.197922  ORF Transcript_77885/g.197922 Transcript_77885/m.197922 type:complete len:259 (-) Transcript_77885:63-839(-)